MEKIKLKHELSSCSLENESRQSQSSSLSLSSNSTTVGREAISLDDQFVQELRKLINNYMQHTTRPFPLKYFLNLTE